VELLPEIRYERRALGTREARANLTQEIMKVFEPVIRRHLDQWFHFVPLWQTFERI
jgi:lauroyl/myristoyl acyltransferase